MSIPFRFLTPEESKASNNVNPYNVIDGKWGGMGLQYWFKHIDPENPRNVFEISETHQKQDDVSTEVTPFWLRVWDVVKEEWCEPTTRESNLSPKHLTKYTWKVGSFDTVSFPIFASNCDKLKHLDLRDILTSNPLRT